MISEDTTSAGWLPFEDFLASPLRNGIYKGKEYHGRGAKVVNMGELFAYPRLSASVEMKRVELTEKEVGSMSLIAGDLVFARRSLTAEGAGKCSIVLGVEAPTTFESSIIRARLDQTKANPAFFYYFFNSPIGKYQIGTILRQVAVAGITGSDLAKLQVPDVAKDVQDYAASILSVLDDKIELNRQINQTLEQMAQALFQAWFVDFEPVKAKVAALADGRDPLRAAMSTLSGKTDAELDELPGAAFDTLAATAALFPEEMEESAEIPKGWEISDIGQEVAVLGGGTPSTANADYWNGEFAWVTPRDLSRLADKVLTMTERRITKAGVQNISSGQLPIGTVLLSSRAPIGYLALTTIPVSINQGFIAMVCSRRLPNMYVLQWATQNLDAIKQRGSGTTFAEISKGNFRPMSVLVPDEKALAAFQRVTLPLYEQITTNVREAETLATLRDSLLPKLLSGELAATPEEQGPERRGIEKGVREGRGIERTWD